MTPSQERQIFKDITRLLDANADLDAKQSERLDVIEAILAPQIKKYHADIAEEKRKKAEAEALAEKKAAEAKAKAEAEAEARAKADEEAKAKAADKKKEGSKPKAKE
uniref:Uncharacterized protein n=1 Tax=viral metagenome TaxID=1070528 RepID=A0A6H1ZL27_9ZZZZ